MTFIKTNNSITLVFTGPGVTSQVHTINTSHPKWNEVFEAVKTGDETLVLNTLSIKKSVEDFTEGNVEIRDNNVFYRNIKLHGQDVDRLMEFRKEGVPFEPLLRFLERKQANPSNRSLTELYKFLEHRNMPLTPEGKVLGYKGVKADFWSVTGNKNTVVLKGKVDSDGRIFNGVGEEIEMQRNSVCDDATKGCESGLHIGSLKYATGFSQTVLIVEFDPADAVSVPLDENCEKLPMCNCTVKAVYT